MKEWPSIPDDVIAWFRSAFADANRRVTERLINVPNIRETSLDDGLIEALIPRSAPKLLSSGAVVEMNIHNTGGLQKFGDFMDLPFSRGRRWEVADIALIILVYSKSGMIAKKVGLLQSKRLFPDNSDVDEDDIIGFSYGMNAFLERSGPTPSTTLHRRFRFDQGCKYGAISANSDQVRSIDAMNSRSGELVYYLLYNPHAVPITVDYPIRHLHSVDVDPGGCVVMRAACVHGELAKLPSGSNPTFGSLLTNSASGRWPLEEWASDLLLTCQVGQRFENEDDYSISNLLSRRSGPIGAAIAASIILPQD